MKLRTGLRLVGALVVAGIAVVAPAEAAGAHPLGNFTVNTSAGLSVERDKVAVDFVVDMAEIPTYQAHRSIDANGDGQVSDAEGSAWAGKTCGEAVRHVQLSVDAKPVPLSVGAASVSFPPGTAGLPTLRLMCGLTASTSTEKGEHQVAWRSSAYTDRVGWREVTAVGSGMSVVSSDVPAVSPSARLTQYPADLLSSPLDQRSASVRVRSDGSALPAVPGGPGAAPGRPSKDVTTALPRGVDAAARSFTALVARRHLTVAFGALALALAVGLGAIHALAPGHGKTVMAAYLVGQRGSLRQAGVIAFTVTTTHTVGVLVLGLVLSASTTLAPESVYPWLGLISGAMLAAVGFSLLRRAIRGRGHVHGPGGHVHGPAGHVHGPAGHVHGPAGLVHEPAAVQIPDPSGRVLEPAGRVLEAAGHVGGPVARVDAPVGLADEPEPGHSHEPGHPHRPPGHPDSSMPGDRPMSRRTLVAMGIAGGMVPSPSALVVLLGALALGRAWFGVVLVVAYGAGMALTLTAAGLLLLRARSVLDRRSGTGPSGSGRLAKVARLMPVVTATVIVVVGLYLAAKGVTQM